MSHENLADVLGELMNRIKTNPGSKADILSQLSQEYEDAGKIKIAATELNNALGAIRIVLQYLLFDLEATRRERDELRMELEDRE